MKLLAHALLVATFASLVVPSQALAEKHRAVLAGQNEVPAISTDGKGTLTLDISADASTISYELTYCCLEVPGVMAAHIHFGQEDVNGGVSAFFCGGGTKPPCPASGPTSAKVSGTIVAADVSGPTTQGIAPGELSELIAAIRAGLTYVNVHTTMFGGGEIRGQIK